MMLYSEIDLPTFEKLANLLQSNINDEYNIDNQFT
jgi:hypothetical protein